MISPSDIKAYTSYRKSDLTWYVVLDILHVWKEDELTDQAESVVLMNVATEEKQTIQAEEFCRWVNTGLLYRKH